MEMLWSDAGVNGVRLPPEIEAEYGGGLALPERSLHANFVASLDGVVDLDTGGESAGSMLSGKNREDRMLMGLLRAHADAVIVGAGTLRAEPSHLWTPDHVFPDLAPAFLAMRRALGRQSEQPTLVVVTASGRLDPGDRAIREGALVITTDEMAAVLRSRLPASCEVMAMGSQRVSMRRAVEALHARGMRALLTEGGPRLIGSLLEEDLLDGVFLTTSPVLAGRGDVRRAGFVEGLELLPARRVEARLVSLRRGGSHLFSQYALRRVAPAP